MVNADWFFAIGKTHDVCEDYAYAEGAPGAAIAVLSDGCSGSSDTDFGARLLVRAAAERLWNDGIEFDKLRTIYQAAAMAKQIGLQESSLDATLLCAKAIKMPAGFLCKIWAQGDGVLVVGRHDGAFEVVEISYRSGMPSYLSYLLNKDRQTHFEVETEGNRPVLTCGLYVDQEKSKGDVQDGKPWPGLAMDYVVHEKFVMLASDGIQSFQRKNPDTGVLEAVPCIEVVKQLLDFKSMKGDFLKRRCKSFLNKFCVKNGWQHTDDFSVVAIDLSDQ